MGHCLTVQLAKAARYKVWGALDETEKAKRPLSIDLVMSVLTQPIWPRSEYSALWSITTEASRSFIAPAQISRSGVFDLLALGNHS